MIVLEIILAIFAFSLAGAWGAGEECFTHVLCQDEDDIFPCSQRDLICCISASGGLILAQVGKKCCQHAVNPVYSPTLEMCNDTEVLQRGIHPFLDQCGPTKTFHISKQKCTPRLYNTYQVEDKETGTVDPTDCATGESNCCCGQLIGSTHLCGRRGPVKKRSPDDDDICFTHLRTTILDITYNSKTHACVNHTVMAYPFGQTEVCGGKFFYNPIQDTCCAGVLYRGLSRGYICCGVALHKQNNNLKCRGKEYVKMKTRTREPERINSYFFLVGKGSRRNCKYKGTLITPETHPMRAGFENIQENFTLKLKGQEERCDLKPKRLYTITTTKTIGAKDNLLVLDGNMKDVHELPQKLRSHMKRLLRTDPKHTSHL
ncbi:uncharacterized protein LOC143462309 isoform X2 [Clavelina lepadiformis]|uniref:Galaxin-like repeats domain-containing protein n=1 Tax=Clavelina lepadiformis TaxID=159417 RepID=A0ABP0FPG2_CLALP